ncbi:hypothetical protein GR212_07080 [Rhizobium lusitanum]|uniref:Uncharacterized protein n=1 Tax=Rhizobium lusitanum TaxID=293958 RepID=A0A6L9U529_9HYPH|nr:hypothetical protein [Rhizobium lusitanum]NEI69336.1 hypothetical protein [Rhizobium lusitanum]
MELYLVTLDRRSGWKAGKRPETPLDLEGDGSDKSMAERRTMPQKGLWEASQFCPVT